jgi:F-type H+-transporting ATPase subunit delta
MQSTRTSIARPYAKAAFEFALEANNLKEWAVLLDQAALVIQEKPMQRLLKDPRPEKMLAYDCLCIACEPMLFSAGTNFLKLIAAYQRLLLLPEMARLFASYLAEHANQVTVQAISVIPLTKAEGQAIKTSLERRLQRQVTLNYHIDSSLLGGLVLQVNDLVVDGSVRGKLERLRAALVN